MVILNEIRTVVGEDLRLPGTFEGVDLTSYTLTLEVRHKDTGVLVTAAVASNDPDQTANKGKHEFLVSALAAGTYRARVRIEPTGGDVSYSDATWILVEPA